LWRKKGWEIHDKLVKDSLSRAPILSAAMLLEFVTRHLMIHATKADLGERVQLRLVSLCAGFRLVSVTLQNMQRLEKEFTLTMDK
jgi:hypothetical protein